MQFRGKLVTLVSFICIMYLNCLVCGKSTDREAIRKQKHLRAKSKDNSEKQGVTNGVRKDLVGSLQEMPVPVHVEHIRDYPVPVPVKNEIPQNVLHVHIHDRNPCQNGGFLTRDIYGPSYHCVCLPQYGGTACEIQQYCFSGPCKNGGACVEVGDGYKCKCSEGFTGDNCEVELFCIPNPCEHDGRCVETLRGYKCVCPDGYKGQHCTDIDTCYPNPCQHGGTCESVNGNARCQCHPEYHGRYCHERYICYNNPCHNRGRCIENPFTPCHCVRGYVGTYCHDHVCHPNPCIHGGSCRVVDHPLGSRNNRWTFHCSCSEYYRGRICQIPHPCIDQPCLNGGTCVDTYYTSREGKEEHYTHDVAVPSMNQVFYCHCPPGFTGLRCEVDICSLCHRDALCIDHRCVCKPHLIGNGHYCRNITDNCNPNPCYHGTCTEGPDGSYDCECHPGYCGTNCKDICKPCLLWPCLNGGRCVPEGEKRKCICVPPYEPPDCNVTVIDLCIPNPCKNGGKCTFLTEKDDYVCDCPGKFTGKDCSVCGCPKAQQSYDDAAKVVDAICDAVGGCKCPESGSNEYTLTDKGCVLSATSPCQPNPCKHGRCEVVPLSNTFICKDCEPPYYGQLCECTTCTCDNPCKNGATCEDTGTKQYKCVCPPGYTGSDCSSPVIPPDKKCSAHKCENGGTCVERLRGYDCICPPQYTGPHCGVDKCANCDVNADCIYGRCRCRRGYIGTGYVCEKIGKESECGICPVHHHCMQGVCVCMPGFICQEEEPDCGVCPVNHHCMQGRCVCIPGSIC